MIANLEEKAEKALNYLVETDLEHATLKAKQARLSEIRKTILAFGFESAQGSAETRRQAAHKTPEYLEHIETQSKADIDFQLMHNRRQTAVVIIELYRTVSANQRRG